ncbi:hypothetical protein OUZ56_019543 [Daphnia magna]|uniref:Uncharacterized protein n=1 Tax=Daphnia magna TaxID=35525 RepID=A0ABQ9ZBW2_9CRUS|nr:hypothetical protein OUZ56_019543 [Daphnia magna]
MAIYKVFQLDGPILERIRVLLQPSSDWGQALENSSYRLSRLELRLTPIHNCHWLYISTDSKSWNWS